MAARTPFGPWSRRSSTLQLTQKSWLVRSGMSDEDKKMLATAHFERGSLYLKDPSEDAQKRACKDFTRALKGVTKAVRARFMSIFSLLARMSQHANHVAVKSSVAFTVWQGDIANTRKLRSECRTATENYQGERQRIAAVS